MKLKSVAAICKSLKMAEVYTVPNTEEQWIGTGKAIYQINNLPELDRESLLTIFDVPEKEKEKWVIDFWDDSHPKGMSLADTVAEEYQVETLEVNISCMEKSFVPIRVQKGIVFIDQKLLSPLIDIRLLMLYERKTAGGNVYIAAKAGMMLKAVIIPTDITSKNIVDDLNIIAHYCDLMLEQKKIKENLGQMQIDADTGEII